MKAWKITQPLFAALYKTLKCNLENVLTKYKFFSNVLVNESIDQTKNCELIKCTFNHC